MSLTEDEIIEHMTKWKFKKNISPKTINGCREAFRVVILNRVDYLEAQSDYEIHNYVPKYRTFLYTVLEMIGDTDQDYADYVTRCLEWRMKPGYLDVVRDRIQERKEFWHKVLKLYVTDNVENHFHTQFKNCVSTQRFWG